MNYRLIAVLLAPPCFCIVIYCFISYFQPTLNKIPGLYQHLQQGNVDLKQGHTAPIDSQQRDTKPIDSHHGHATPPGKNEGTNHDTPTKTNSKLPQFVIDQFKTYVFFLRFAHSGHSIVGSLMDSHPHIVISHELNVFALLSQGMISPIKQDIFNAIWNNTQQTIINGIRAKNVKGYNLLVDSLYQGKYVNYFDVIGADKKGG